VLPSVNLVLANHMTTSDAATSWLAAALGIKQSTHGPDLAQSIMALPPSFITIDNGHFLFLRRVGGFSGLRKILGIMHSTSDHHFWVVGFHGPAWWYLNGVAQSVNMPLFRKQVALNGRSSSEEAEWLVSQVESLGHSVRFSSLANPGLLGGDHSRAIERATSAYWRLVHEAVDGNPTLLLQTFADSLCDSGDHLSVKMPKLPDTDSLTRLSDVELFLLTGLVIHGSLDLQELGQVLNISSGVVRATCRKLEADGVITANADLTRLSLSLLWTPTVHKVLRQKHFIHEV